MTRPSAQSFINRSFLEVDIEGEGLGGGFGGGRVVASLLVAIVSALLVRLRVLTVGRKAIRLMYSIVAVKVDPGIFEVRTKFSSSSMPVLRLLKRVLKPDRMDS